MPKQLDTLTTAEAAVVAGVSVRDVHRMIDEHILPECFFATNESRSFRSEACVFISFYFGAADRLTSEERLRSIALASKIPDWSMDRKVVQDGFLTIDFASFSEGVSARLKRLETARKMVICDPEILGGTPVVRGTRVPVYMIASAVTAGTSVERILASYPSLTREQVELAALYAEATPQRGRPRQHTTVPTGATLIAKRRKVLQQTV